MRHQFMSVLLAIVIIGLLTSCTESGPLSPATPTATPQPTVTATLIPTATPTLAATATPPPTAPLSPLATPTLASPATGLSPLPTVASQPGGG